MVKTYRLEDRRDDRAVTLELALIVQGDDMIGAEHLAVHAQ